MDSGQSVGTWPALLTPGSSVEGMKIDICSMVKDLRNGRIC